MVGHGTIGSLLARTLRALGARVHVAARSPIQRAAARADGCMPLPLEDLAALAPSLDMVFVDRARAGRRRDDPARLAQGQPGPRPAPPPDHADLDLAAQSWGTAVWARGLGGGRRSPSAPASGWGCSAASRLWRRPVRAGSGPMTSRGLEVAVVGGGAVGLSCAYEWRWPAPSRWCWSVSRTCSGCSAGSAGLLSPAHSTPLATPGAVKVGAAPPAAARQPLLDAPAARGPVVARALPRGRHHGAGHRRDAAAARPPRSPASSATRFGLQRGWTRA